MTTAPQADHAAADGWDWRGFVGGCAPQPPVSRPRPVRGYASGKDDFLRLLRARAWPLALQ